MTTAAPAAACGVGLLEVPEVAWERGQLADYSWGLGAYGAGGCRPIAAPRMHLRAQPQPPCWLGCRPTSCAPTDQPITHCLTATDKQGTQACGTSARWLQDSTACRCKARQGKARPLHQGAQRTAAALATAHLRLRAGLLRQQTGWVGTRLWLPQPPRMTGSTGPPGRPAACSSAGTTAAASV